MACLVARLPGFHPGANALFKLMDNGVSNAGVNVSARAVGLMGFASVCSASHGLFLPFQGVPQRAEQEPGVVSNLLGGGVKGGLPRRTPSLDDTPPPAITPGLVRHGLRRGGTETSKRA